MEFDIDQQTQSKENVANELKSSIESVVSAGQIGSQSVDPTYLKTQDKGTIFFVKIKKFFIFLC